MFSVCNTYVGVEVQIQALLISAPDEDTDLHQIPGRFTPGDRTQGTRRAENWLSP